MSPQTHVESDARTVGTIMYRTTEQLEVPHRLHRAKEVKVLHTEGARHTEHGRHKSVPRQAALSIFTLKCTISESLR